MQGLTFVLFAIVAGFTASGLIANLYRVAGVGGAGRAGQILRVGVLIVAGPSVVFEMAIRSLLAKEWSPGAFWLVASLIAYWSLGLGLVVLEIAASL